jgi:integrase
MLVISSCFTGRHGLGGTGVMSNSQEPKGSEHYVFRDRNGTLRHTFGARRWHDNRHTLVTELAESGAGDEVIMSIAGHVSRAMLSRYCHVRLEAKRHALDEIAARQRADDEKRREEIRQQQQTVATSEPVLVQ